MPGTPTLDIPALAQRARASGRLAIDTEFMSEGRYRPLLCLVQVAVEDAAEPAGVRIELLDPLAGLEPGPLAEVLADPAIEVVLHAGGQDVAILKREWRTAIHNVFDTQLAAGFAGLPAQAAYNVLLQSLLDVRLAKSASFTRWDARPLSEEQRAYARADVAHLFALADAIKARLEGGGRTLWATEECRRLEEISDERDPDAVWQRLPRIARLSSRELAVAQALAAWRERTAADENRPVGSVLADATLVELAKRQPADMAALEQVRGAHPGVLRRRGKDVLAAIEGGLAAPPIVLEQGEREGSDPHDAALVALSEALVRSRALDAGLAYELIATRGELTAIVRAARSEAPEPDVRALRGWRRDLVGAELLDLLAGRRSLDVDRSGRLRVLDTGDPTAG